MPLLPQTGYPARVLPLLLRVVVARARNSQVQRFRIGRTAHLSNTRSRLDANHVEALYQTDSPDHAIAVEQALVAEMFEHPKSVNEANHAGGGVSSYVPQFIYIAYWF